MLYKKSTTNQNTWNLAYAFAVDATSCATWSCNLLYDSLLIIQLVLDLLYTLYRLWICCRPYTAYIARSGHNALEVFLRYAVRKFTYLLIHRLSDKLTANWSTARWSLGMNR